MPIMALNTEYKQKMIKKARQLCDYISNLIIYDPQLTIEVNTFHLCVAMILEARRKCQLTPIWPEEMDLMVFGPSTDLESKRAV